MAERTGSAVADRLKSAVERLDRAQRSHTASAVAVAVWRKFSKDQGPSLAALMAYFGFFSLFPLLLVVATITSTFVHADKALQDKIAASTVAEFPIIGQQIRTNVSALTGSLPALIIGLFGALWAGLGVVAAARRAMDTVWEVSKEREPSFAARIIRGLVVLFALGSAIIAIGLIGAWAASLAFPWTVLGSGVACVLNILLFLVGFRVLTVADVTWSDLAPGAIAGGVIWSMLLAIGSLIVSHDIKRASEIYGFFAVVIGLLSWLYLGAQITLICAELNVVLARHLWPKRLTG